MENYQRVTLVFRYYIDNIKYEDIPIETNYPYYLDKMTTEMNFNELIKKFVTKIYHDLFLRNINVLPIYTKKDTTEEENNLIRSGYFYYTEDNQEKSLLYTSEKHIFITCLNFISGVKSMYEYLISKEDNPLYQILSKDEVNMILNLDPSYTNLYAKSILVRIRTTNFYYNFYRDISTWKYGHKNNISLPKFLVREEDIEKENDELRLTKQSKTYLEYLSE